MAKITGTPGNDTLGGTHKKDTISGAGGDDTLLGRGGDDTIKGDDGDDTLIGEAGADTLTGGAGADTFKIKASFDMTNNAWTYSPDRDGERDTITDFNSAQGDKIDLRGLIRNVDMNNDGVSEQYPVAWADVDVITLGAGTYRIVVHQVTGDPTFDLGIDVNSPTEPVEGDFIF